MRNNFFKILVIIMLFSNTGCSRHIFSPHVVFTNASKDVLYNITGNWNGYLLSGHLKRYPGDSAGDTFLLQKKSDLYGPIRLEWLNAKKEKIVKEIEFTREYIPNLDPRKLPFVNFYLTQDDLKMFVAPHGILFANEEEKNISKQAVQFQKDYEASHPEKCFKAYGCSNK
jgi:hypothetical protein